ncbi:hypothetical protein ERUR111494_03135 [Erysipelothrix urinaevulpis]|uniref:hypothetical protein n=1 Tax=Erysipelothrix urinaevulpis TaxID=2683717 RepID=UPI00135ACC3E|nr:hypothetical protein [Erysipelothrix urinaevulpis]
MKNYYDEIIHEIVSAIDNQNYTYAKTLLEQELLVPYVPEPYNSKFIEMYKGLPNENNVSNQYFTAIEDIEKALEGTEAFQMKALRSLEKSNLRMFVNELDYILYNNQIEDWIKKQILVLMLEQGLSGEKKIWLHGHEHCLKLEDLCHPFKTEEFTQAYRELQNRYESNNPSFLKLCLAELQFQSSSSFPFKQEPVDVDGIVDTIKQYLSIEEND